MSDSQGTSSQSDIDNKDQDHIDLAFIFTEVEKLLKSTIICFTSPEHIKKDDDDTELVKILVKLDSYCKVIRETVDKQEKPLSEISEKDDLMRKTDQEKLDLEKNIKHLEKRLKECVELNKKLETSHNKELDKAKEAINKLKIEKDKMKKKAASYNLKASNVGGTQTLNINQMGKCTDDACKRELEDTKRALEMKQAENNAFKLELQNQNKALKEKITESDDWKKKYEKSIGTIRILRKQISDLNKELNTVTHIPVS